jgi:hypothetical protein
MQSPPSDLDFNKQVVEPGNSRYHLLNAALLATLWGLTFALQGNLPDQIPGHIGPSGVTRWDSSTSGMWLLMPILGSIHALVLYALSGIGQHGLTGLNVPRKERLLAMSREGQRFAVRPVRTFMYLMAAWLLALMIGIQLVNYRVALAGGIDRQGSFALILGILAFTAIPVIMAIHLGRVIHRRADEWEAAGGT